MNEVLICCGRREIVTQCFGTVGETTDCRYLDSARYRNSCVYVAHDDTWPKHIIIKNFVKRKWILTCIAIAWQWLECIQFCHSQNLKRVFFLFLYIFDARSLHTSDEWTYKYSFFFVVVALSIPLEQTDVTFIYIYAECWMQRDNTAGMAWQDKCVWTRNGIHFFLLCISCCMHAFNALLGHFLSFLFFFHPHTTEEKIWIEIMEMVE